MPGLFGGIDMPSSQIVMSTLTSQVASVIPSMVQNAIKSASGANAGAVGSTVDASSWYTKAAARNDPHLHIDWDIEMPNGFPSEMIESVTAPLLEYDSGGGVFRGGTSIYMPEAGSVGILSLVLYEDNVFTSTNYVNAWRSTIANNGVYGYAKDFKKQISVFALDVTGQTIATFTYHGCWPAKSQQGYTFASDNSERTVLNVEFPVDYMSIQVSGGSGQGGFAGNLGAVQLGAPNPFAPLMSALSNTVNLSVGTILPALQF